MSLTFTFGCLIKRRAYFKIRRNFDILLLILKSKIVISCQFSKVLETRIWGHRAVGPEQ